MVVVDGDGGFALFINLRQKTENKTRASRKPELSPTPPPTTSRPAQQRIQTEASRLKSQRSTSSDKKTFCSPVSRLVLSTSFLC